MRFVVLALAFAPARVNALASYGEGARAAVPRARVDILFTAECVPPFDWMAAGVFESFRSLYGDGDGGRIRITRLLACSDEQFASYRLTPGFKLGPTFVHRNYKHNPHNGDNSGSYNKPGSIMHWVQDPLASAGAETVLFIDADMVLRRRVEPYELGAKEGVVASARVGYLIGTRNGLAQRFLPDSVRPDLVQPAGWVHAFHINDIRAIAPRWLYYTEQVRTRPQEYWATSPNSTLQRHIPTGDAYAKPGQVPWIAEMCVTRRGASRLCGLLFPVLLVFPLF